MAEKEFEEIQKAMEIIDEMSMDSKEWELYESREKAIMDYNSGMKAAERRGREERNGETEEKSGIQERNGETEEKNGIEKRKKTRKNRNCKKIIRKRRENRGSSKYNRVI